MIWIWIIAAGVAAWWLVVLTARRRARMEELAAAAIAWSDALRAQGLDDAAAQARYDQAEARLLAAIEEIRPRCPTCGREDDCDCAVGMP